mmetsp:Transcript_50516/g.134338  ORF Transcript_50516/g.134338 Transcript_50516/m.134338 type:complete len:156 (+) Transcript_50516:152-619(+)
MYTPHASTRGTSRRRPGGKAKSPQAVLVVRGPLVLATSRAKRMMLRRANLERPKQGALVNTVQALALANNLHLAERAGRVFSGLSAASARKLSESWSEAPTVGANRGLRPWEIRSSHAWSSRLLRLAFQDPSKPTLGLAVLCTTLGRQWSRGRPE